MNTEHKPHRLYGSLFLFAFLIGSFWVFEQSQLHASSGDTTFSDHRNFADGAHMTKLKAFRAMTDGEQIDYLIAKRNPVRTHNKYPFPTIQRPGRNAG